MDSKRAFTVVELLVTFGIISILMVLSYHTANERFTDFFTRYYTAFDALNKAVYNTYTDTYCRVQGVSEDGKRDCSRDNTAGTDYIKTGRPFPDTPEKLCKRLSEYLNVTKNSTCKTASISDNGDNFNDSTLQFTLSNGFRFYFSGKKSAVVNHGGKKPKNVDFFIVYVDLNGKGEPNRVTLPHPDTVPFIITFTGDVIPVGYPVHDKSYASARIVDGLGKETKSFTIDEARQLAFGNVPYTDMPITMIPFFNALLPDNVKPSGTFTTYNIGDEGTASMKCEAGTYVCVLKIDENFGKRH